MNGGLVASGIGGSDVWEVRGGGIVLLVAGWAILGGVYGVGC